MCCSRSSIYLLVSSQFDRFCLVQGSQAIHLCRRLSLLIRRAALSRSMRSKAAMYFSCVVIVLGAALLRRQTHCKYAARSAAHSEPKRSEAKLRFDFRPGRKSNRTARQGRGTLYKSTSEKIAHFSPAFSGPLPASFFRSASLLFFKPSLHPVFPLAFLNQIMYDSNRIVISSLFIYRR